jgi:hypothetical protein
MDTHELPEWQFDSSTGYAFNDLWANDFDALDFQPPFIDLSDATPGTTDSLNTLPLFDDLAIENMSLQDPTVVSDNASTFDSFTLDDLMRNNRPTPPQQRTLPRRRSKYVLRKSGSYTKSIAIPTTHQNSSPLESLAIQRWQNSPPEEEAASLSAIYTAMEQRPFNGSARGSRTPSFDAFQRVRGPSSSTSLDSGVSENSVQSAHSNHSNHSASSQTRRRRVTKPRSTTKVKGKTKNPADRIFKCTFCCDTFKHKYDWARHEKSLHLNMDEWICTPHGGSVVLPLTRRVHCAYCSALDPTNHHLDSHNHSACHGGQSTPRTFRRKDHLVQHLRLVHGLDTLPLIDDWKLDSAPIVSRCGFCDTTLNSWDERTHHLASHFRSGKTMADWHGDHGFDAEVDARVSYSFPPYLIAAQTETLVPFSATNHESIDHTKQMMSRMEQELLASAPTEIAQEQPVHDDVSSPPLQQGAEAMLFAESLTRHLARFARQQMLLGVIPTDEMFQRESRRVLYQDADDEWNQTVADSPEWIRQFRERTGV